MCVSSSAWTFQTTFSIQSVQWGSKQLVWFVCLFCWCFSSKLLIVKSVSLSLSTKDINHFKSNYFRSCRAAKFLVVAKDLWRFHSWVWGNKIKDLHPTRSRLRVIRNGKKSVGVRGGEGAEGLRRKKFFSAEGDMLKSKQIHNANFWRQSQKASQKPWLCLHRVRLKSHQVNEMCTEKRVDTVVSFNGKHFDAAQRRTLDTT